MYLAPPKDKTWLRACPDNAV